MQSLARNSATPVTNRTLALDVGGADGPLDDGTVRDYLNAMRLLMILEEQPAWAPHLRSRSKRRKRDQKSTITQVGNSTSARSRSPNPVV